MICFCLQIGGEEGGGTAYGSCLKQNIHITIFLNNPLHPSIESPSNGLSLLFSEWYKNIYHLRQIKILTS